MKITVLGSASGIAVPNRNPSSYIVETKNRVYMIDVGDGTVRQMLKYGFDQNSIRCIFISHTHPDHASGLFSVLQMMRLTNRTNPLEIYLPRGVLPGFESIFPYFQIYREKWDFHFHLLPIKPGFLYDGDAFQLSAVANNHLKENLPFADKLGMDADSYSFKFQESDDNAVIYTSDIDTLDHLRPLNSGVRVLISECTHVTVDEIVNFAVSAGIDRIVLTHVPPELEGNSSNTEKDEQNPNIEFASDGFNIEV
jgi:ribonuclease BN (tRNA processing enzyme)